MPKLNGTAKWATILIALMGLLTGCAYGYGKLAQKQADNVKYIEAHTEQIKALHEDLDTLKEGQKEIKGGVDTLHKLLKGHL